MWLAGLALDDCGLKKFGQLLERLLLLVPNTGIGGSRCWVLERIDGLGGGNCYILCQESERNCGIMRKEFYRISLENCLCLRQVYVVEYVVVCRSIDIPAISSSGLPTLADSRLDVHNDLGAWSGNISGFVVRLDMKLRLGREGAINSRWPKKIQGEYRLWKDLTPQVQRKIVVCGD